jgi:hypothetical protein
MQMRPETRGGQMSIVSVIARLPPGDTAAPAAGRCNRPRAADPAGSSGTGSAHRLRQSGQPDAGAASGLLLAWGSIRLMVTLDLLGIPLLARDASRSTGAAVHPGGGAGHRHSVWRAACLRCLADRSQRVAETIEPHPHCRFRPSPPPARCWWWRSLPWRSSCSLAQAGRRVRRRWPCSTTLSQRRYFAHEDLIGRLAGP